MFHAFRPPPQNEDAMDIAAVKRLSRALRKVTNDARNLTRRPGAGDLLADRVKLAAALADQLALVLEVDDVDRAINEYRAAAAAAEAIARVQEQSRR
jgi:hypothetical protein